MKRSHGKKPLYRKNNNVTHGVHNTYSGGDYKDTRHTKQESRIGMQKGVKRGLDYTPLYKFLLSKVGQPWDAVFSEAVSRLDKREPIFYMVYPSREVAGEDAMCVGESSYFSRLYVDEDGLLQKVNPELGPHNFEPTCGCHTHTFNGKPVAKKYKY